MSIEKLSPEVAALLVVDLQNDYCDKNGLMAERGFDVGAIPEMVSRLETLVEAARQTHVPVIWIQTTHDETTNSRVWLARKSPDLTAESPPPSNCWTGTWGAEPYQLIPGPGDPVITKHRYSAFAGTSLVWTLRGLGRESLLITGVSTEACVESTLRDGLFHDFHVNLVEDCCSSYSREAHEATVRNARNLFGLVLTSEQVMSQWLPETVRPPVRQG
jgi:nicotinamidase-related amidase